MSLKRQIQHKYQNFKFSIRTIAVPAWVTSRAMRVGLFFTIFLFGTAYILNITASATSGYQVRELEKNTQSLEMEVRKLEVEIADNSSITSIASRLEKLNMTEATSVKHVAMKSSIVAKN